jgi:plasmid stability protein
MPSKEARMKTMNIRNIPDDLHKALKIQAAKEGTTMEDVIRRALAEYLKKEAGK